MRPAVMLGLASAITLLAVSAMPWTGARVAVSLAVVVGTAAALLWDEQRHLLAEVERRRGLGVLLGGVERLPVPGPLAVDGDASGLARAVEAAGERIAGQLQALEAERNGLAESLSRRDRRLRDPLVDARRDRIAALDGVAVDLGGRAAGLVDLQLDHAVLAVPPELADRLVPGLPVAMRLEVGGAVVAIPSAIAVAPAQGGDDRVEWVFRFAQRLAPEQVPAPLWVAMAARRVERVRPPASLPATGTLVAGFGSLPITVADLSTSGCGLVVALSAEQLAELHHGLALQLTFPTMGRMAVLSATLRSVGPASAPGEEPRWRLGLAFPGSGGPERGAIEAWIKACALAEVAPSPGELDRSRPVRADRQVT